jgi:hypothetical protein
MSKPPELMHGIKSSLLGIHTKRRSYTALVALDFSEIQVETTQVF